MVKNRPVLAVSVGIFLAVETVLGLYALAKQNLRATHFILIFALLQWSGIKSPGMPII